MLVLDFKTTRQVANAFANLLKADGQCFSSRAYNRYEPDETVWWVIPNTEWPAYKYGKYVFQNEEYNIFCGLHIEKGFGDSVKELNSSLEQKGQIISNDWLWNEFITSVENENIENDILKIKKIIDEEIFIKIGIDYASDPTDYDPNALKPNMFIYKYDNGNLSFDKEKSNYENLIDETLYSLLDIKKLSDIPNVFKNIKGLSWYWIDFYIGIPFNKRNDDLNSKNLIDENKLSNILSPLEYWIR